MDTIKIVVYSAITFPAIVTVGVMIFVKYAIKKRKEREEMIGILEDVVLNQDSVLADFKKILE